MSDESDALSGELFRLVEYDQGKAFISDETAALLPSEVLDSAERLLSYTRRVARLLERFLVTHGRPPSKREFRIPPHGKRKKETAPRKPRADLLPHQRFINRNKERISVIVGLYCGLNDDQPQTLEQIGQHFGLTRERIRQLLLKANLFYEETQLAQFKTHRDKCRTPIKPAVKPGTVIRRAIKSGAFEPSRSWLTAQGIQTPDNLADDPISLLTWIHDTCRITTFPGYHWCHICRWIKTLSEFGKSARCKTCNISRTREWNKRFPEKVRAVTRAYYDQHKAKYAEWNRLRWSRLSPEQKAESNARSLVRTRARYKKLKTENPEKLREQWKQAQRRQREKKECE